MCICRNSSFAHSKKRHADGHTYTHIHVCIFSPFPDHSHTHRVVVVVVTSSRNHWRKCCVKQSSASSFWKFPARECNSLWQTSARCCWEFFDNSGDDVKLTRLKRKHQLGKSGFCCCLSFKILQESYYNYRQQKMVCRHHFQHTIWLSELGKLSKTNHVQRAHTSASVSLRNNN